MHLQKVAFETSVQEYKQIMQRFKESLCLLPQTTDPFWSVAQNDKRDVNN